MRHLFLGLLFLASPVLAQFQDTDPSRYGPEMLQGKLGSVGNNDNLGTLPLNSSTSGGPSGGAKEEEGGGSAGKEPSTTRTEKPVVVDPCSTDENGGSAAANQCSSDGKIILKSNGDVTCTAGTVGIVEAGDGSDVITVGADSSVAATGPACTVVICSFNTTVYATNTSDTGPMLVKVQGVNAWVPPGTSATFQTAAAPIN